MTGKPSLRDWLSAQHAPPDIADKLERLFGLSEKWKKLADRMYSVDPYSLGPQTAMSCAAELNSILEDSGEPKITVDSK